MSEYWKSTPKYWCKHCSTYVKDTKFERAQHEATGRHQGNLKRFLRTIQNNHEKDEREKQRAKAEVDRLNKAVGGGPAAAGKSIGATTRQPLGAASSPQALAAERKQQVAKLVEMGIAVPDEYRPDMALAGEWKMVSQRPIEEASADATLSVGVRKRKFEDQEEEEEVGGAPARRGWGSTTKDYPGRQIKNEDLDALLSGKKVIKKEEPEPFVKQEIDEGPGLIDGGLPPVVSTNDASLPGSGCDVKREQGEEQSLPENKSSEAPHEDRITEVVFKKRKPKSVRKS